MYVTQGHESWTVKSSEIANLTKSAYIKGKEHFKYKTRRIRNQNDTRCKAACLSEMILLAIGTHCIYTSCRMTLICILPHYHLPCLVLISFQWEVIYTFLPFLIS